MFQLQNRTLNTFLNSVNLSFEQNICCYERKYCPLGHMDRTKQICYLSPMRAAKVQANLRIRAVSPEPPLLAHTSSESRGTFRQKTRFLAPLNGWACTVKICHDGMLKDTNSLDGAHIIMKKHLPAKDFISLYAIMFLSFRTDRHLQTV